MPPHDRTSFAIRYAAEWSGQDPVALGSFYDEAGSLIVNGAASDGSRANRRPAPLRDPDRPHKLNHMVQYASARLDAAFAALADATRRGVLEQLGGGDASITELADRFGMTLTGMKKHVGVLEEAGLVRTEKVGRVRTCRLGPQRLAEVNAWLERYRTMWEERFAELDRVLEELQHRERPHGRRARQ